MNNSDTRGMELPPTFEIAGKTITLCQARIISLAALGLLRKTIADHLGNSRHTIDTHLDRIYKLLGINDGRQLVAWALANGFDQNGNLHGVYLFPNLEEAPWEFERRA